MFYLFIYDILQNFDLTLLISLFRIIFCKLDDDDDDDDDVVCYF